MVARVRIGLTTRGSSGHCSTTELPRHLKVNQDFFALVSTYLYKGRMSSTIFANCKSKTSLFLIIIIRSRLSGSLLECFNFSKRYTIRRFKKFLLLAFLAIFLETTTRSLNFPTWLILALILK